MQFHCCKRISQIWTNSPQISDSSSPLTGVANISQFVGPDTGEQSPEEGRGINKKQLIKVGGKSPVASTSSCSQKDISGFCLLSHIRQGWDSPSSSFTVFYMRRLRACHKVTNHTQPPPTNPTYTTSRFFNCKFFWTAGKLLRNAFNCLDFGDW